MWSPDARFICLAPQRPRSARPVGVASPPLRHSDQCLLPCTTLLSQNSRWLRKHTALCDSHCQVSPGSIQESNEAAVPQEGLTLWPPKLYKARPTLKALRSAQYPPYVTKLISIQKPESLALVPTTEHCFGTLGQSEWFQRGGQVPGMHYINTNRSNQQASPEHFL